MSTKTRVHEDGPATVITLTYPERRNAIGPTMVDEIRNALDAAKTPVIVLTGEGKSFCSGGDFAEMMSGAAMPPRGDYAELLLAMMRSEKPIIAKINGTAMGGGFGLAAAATFAIASSEAQLGTPEIGVGLFPMMIMAVLARIVPRRKLLEMMLLGQRISAEEAKAIGVLNAVVAPGELDAAVSDLAGKLAKNSSMTMKLGLRAYADQEGMGVEEALPMLRDRLGECLATNDAREGLSAFLQKRPPNWSHS